MSLPTSAERGVCVCSTRTQRQVQARSHGPRMNWSLLRPSPLREHTFFKASEAHGKPEWQELDCQEVLHTLGARIELAVNQVQDLDCARRGH